MDVSRFYRRLSPLRRFMALMLGIAACVLLSVGIPGSILSASSQLKPAAPPQTARQNTGVYRFNVGTLKAATISDGIFNFPSSAIVPVADPAQVKQALYDDFQTDEFVGYTNILYLETDRHRILIDSGSGNNFLPTVGALKDNLQAAGINPATIDTIILSHAHVDHIGGIADKAGKLTFPKARYYIAKKEWDFWTDPKASLPLSRMDDANKKNAIATAKKFLGLIRDRVQFFQPGQEILPGITAVDVAGHTPGHSAFAIQSGGDRLMVTSDTFFSNPLNLEHPDWEVAFDADPKQAIATRKRVLSEASRDRLEVLAYHMPFPGLGHVRAQGDRYEWKPSLWKFTP